MVIYVDINKRKIVSGLKLYRVVDRIDVKRGEVLPLSIVFTQNGESQIVAANLLIALCAKLQNDYDGPAMVLATAFTLVTTGTSHRYDGTVYFTDTNLNDHLSTTGATGDELEYVDLQMEISWHTAASVQRFATESILLRVHNDVCKDGDGVDLIPNTPFDFPNGLRTNTIAPLTGTVVSVSGTLSATAVSAPTATISNITGVTVATTGAISTSGASADIYTSHASASVRSYSFKAIDATAGAALRNSAGAAIATFGTSGQNWNFQSGTTVSFDTTSFTMDASSKANMKNTLAIGTGDITGFFTTNKASIADGDKVAILDSAASNAPKHSLWSLVKSTLKTYFDTLYAATGTGLPSGGSTGDVAKKNSGTNYDVGWETPTSAATANAIVRRDAVGGAEFGEIIASSIFTTATSGSIFTVGSDASIFTAGTTGTIYTQGANAVIYTQGATAPIYTQGANSHIETQNSSASVKSYNFAAIDATAGASLRDSAGTAYLTWGATAGNISITVDTTSTGHFFSNPGSATAGHFITKNGTTPTIAVGRSAWFTNTAGAPQYRNGTGSAVALIYNGSALGTPSSGTLTNCSGLPVSTGISGLGTNVGAFLATPTSANLAAALTDETGSGAVVFATSPTISTPKIVEIKNTAGITSLNTDTALLSDSGNYASIDFQNRWLYGNLGSWITLDWNNCQLNDNSGNISIDWTERWLSNFNGDIVFDYTGNRSSGTPFSFDNSGNVCLTKQIAYYNNFATAGNGQSAIRAVHDTTTNAAAKTATTLYAVPAANGGSYRISFVAKVTRAATTSSVLGGTGAFQAIYTDADDSVVVTTGTITNVSGANLAGNTTQTVYSGTVTVNAKESTNIQFTFGYTSVGATTMQYNLHVRCEQI